MRCGQNYSRTGNLCTTNNYGMEIKKKKRNILFLQRVEKYEAKEGK